MIFRYEYLDLPTPTGVMPTAGKYDDTEFDVLLYEFKTDLNKYLADANPNVKSRTLADLIKFNEENRDREMPYFGQEIFEQAQAKGTLAADKYKKALAKNQRMEWALGECPGVEELIEYESRMNGILAGYRDVVICAYDTTRFSAATILDVIRSHPAVIIGGKLMENSLYTPTDQLVEQLHAR